MHERCATNVSSYDGFYVPLARVVGCPLITCDRALADAPDLGITLTVIDVKDRENSPLATMGIPHLVGGL